MSATDKTGTMSGNGSTFTTYDLRVAKLAVMQLTFPRNEKMEILDTDPWYKELLDLYERFRWAADLLEESGKEEIRIP